MNRAMPSADGAPRELLEHARGDPDALFGVGDGERDLGGVRIAQPRVAGERDDALGAGPGLRADQRAARRPVGVEVGVDEPGVRSHGGEEAEAHALRGEPREERGERLPVGRLRLPQTEGPAVAQDDVGEQRRAGHATTRTLPCAPATTRAATDPSSTSPASRRLRRPTTMVSYA